MANRRFARTGIDRTNIGDPFTIDICHGEPGVLSERGQGNTHRIGDQAAPDSDRRRRLETSCDEQCVLDGAGAQ